jgi:hypothetical protein
LRASAGLVQVIKSDVIQAAAEGELERQLRHRRGLSS